MTDLPASPFGTSGPLRTTPVAIIGLASIFPQARNLPEYWSNILKKIDCITDVPLSRWNIEDYYDPNPLTPDKTYCKRGGFIPDVEFDPMEFGLPPNILEVTDISQLLSLVVTKEVLEDAGYGEGRNFERDRTGVILGVVGISTKIFTPLMSRLQYPVWEKVLTSFGIAVEDRNKIIAKMKLAYINWEENAFPGTIANVISGRIANRFDLGGTNCVVDAACASSLAAIKMAVGELVEGRADMMITGGVDTDNSIGSYMCFSKTPAFSKSDRVRTFDAESDGMMVGEGLGMVVLKRLADAERDGDRIYAVIRGIGSSSDGRFKSIYAPRPSGQSKALRRAYQEAGYEPNTVGLIEAHGTGTNAGDPSEFQGMREVFAIEDHEKQSIALGSVKSQIAHTKAAAGAASLIKVSLALHHKIFPPTINVTRPNPKLDIESTPFYLNTETRPWIQPARGNPRRAGVSSFGFGGTNFHIAVEEYQSEHQDAYRLNKVAQPVLLSAPTRLDLLTLGQETLGKLKSDQASHVFNELTAASESAAIPESFARLGFVAETPEEASQTLQIALDTLKAKVQENSWEHQKGIYYQESAVDPKGKVVVLFPGQGSQYVDMGRELALNFPPIRQVFGVMDSLFIEDGRKPLSKIIYPAPVFDQETKEQQTEVLQSTEYAQPAIGSLSVGVYKILAQAGLTPDFVAGHSFGELTALWAAGVINEDDFLVLAKARGKAMAPPENPDFDAGTMLAVKGDVSQIQLVANNFPEVTLANWNSCNQVVLAGPRQAIEQVQQSLKEQGFSVTLLPVSAAFHTPLVGHAQKPFAGAIDAAQFNRPTVRVLSNSTGDFYPDDPAAIRQVLADHILKPVLFKDEIEKVYSEGGTIFIECGPKNVLTNLVKTTLGDRPHIAVALNASPKKDSDRQLREAVVQLRVVGLNLTGIDPYQAPLKTESQQKKSAVTVTLNGGQYISEKTRSAFSRALQQRDHLSQASYPAAIPAILPAPRPMAMIPATKIEVVDMTVSELNSAHHKTNTQPEKPVSEPVQGGEGYGSEFLARNLEQFNAQQGEILHVHEKYLDNDAEFARTFAQLSQAELALISTPGANLTLMLPIIEKLEASINRLHDHQAETLRVHENYLKNQSELAQQFLDLTRNVVGGARNITLPTREPHPARDLPKRPAEIKGQAVAPTPISQVFTAPILQEVAPKINLIKTLPQERIITPITPKISQPAPAGLNPQIITGAFLKVVSEKTGYPEETLELDMDMEADLGIDSIKRVEILGAVRTMFPELPKVDPETFAELRTLRQVSDHLNQSYPVANQQPAINEDLTPAAQTYVGMSAAIAPVPAQAGNQIDAANLSRAFLEVVSEKTGYPVETLELDMDMEADLGIDSIKRVEILGGVRFIFPDLPKVEPETFAELRTLRQVIDHLAGSVSSSIAPWQPEPTVDPIVLEKTDQEGAVPEVLPASTGAGHPMASGEIAQAFLEVVSEKTGYPMETLELDMDMESDLGIDSIKRVEILGGVRALYPELPKVDPDTFAELRTLRQVKDYLEKSLDSVAVFPFQQPVLQRSEIESSLISRGVVSLKLLPAPDFQDFTIPAGHICLVTDDGTLLTPALVEALSDRGWKVVVVSLPQSLLPSHSPLPAGIDRVFMDDVNEDTLVKFLNEITQAYGPVAAFLNLAIPRLVHNNGRLDFSEVDRTVVKLVFLMAKHLKESLNKAAQKGRGIFMTVTHLDGEFGLGQETDYAPLIGGLAGLVKSLNLEWEAVYCRALDLSPALEPAQAVSDIVAELYDPNRLVTEVGYNQRGRVTLVVDQTNGAEVLK